MYSLILCGGSGTRLWPLSRKNFPKQFLNFYSDNSLVQETYLRIKSIMPAENIFFITNETNIYNVFNQIKNIDKNFSKKQILVEPISLNTAPALAFAIKFFLEKIKIDPDAPIVVLPSDHYIGDKKEFLNVLKNALNKTNDYIGTIGITPLKPETSFGYIKKGEKIQDFYKVEQFIEKPKKETAKQYFDSGQYVWNSGMYIFSVNTFVKELKKYAKEIYDLLTQDYNIFLEKFNKMPDISIDFAISEKSNNIIVFEGNFNWSDIGSFDSLSEIKKDDLNEKHIRLNSKNIFINSTSNKMVAALGIQDINIIETNDSILVQKQGEGENVKELVKLLKKRDSKELNDSRIAYRPWGSYEILIDTPTYKVKKIVVHPGAKLSLQSHYHRAEHWIVVKGMAKVTNGEKITHLNENESTFIPALTIHRLENPGKINIELIEVQTGDYLEEDDITRFNDDFGRISKKSNK